MGIPILKENRYMLAQQVALLKNAKLCDFLKQMDAEEQKVLDQEQENITQSLATFHKEHETQGSWGKTLLGTSALVSSILVGRTFFGHRIKTVFDRFIPVIYAANFIVLLTGLGLYGSSLPLLLERNWITQITDEHICRLQDKVRKIEEKLTSNILGTEKDQLNQAKDSFYLKYIEMISKKTNKLEVEIRSK